MAESFLISIKNNKPNEEAHRLFLRFGSGVFQREKITIRKGTTIDVSSGFDYLGVLQEIFLEAYENEDIEYSGVIIGLDAKKALVVIEDSGLKVIKSVGKKHTVKGIMKGKELLKSKKVLFDIRAGFLVSFVHGKNTLKSKTAYPKPGKIVEGFVKMKIEKNSFNNIIEAFGLKEFKKKAVIETTYDISKVVFDDTLLKKDPAKARLDSKRDTKLIRKMIVDGTEEKDEMSALI